MYANRRILALIPARGGSKGVVHKNTRLVAGKPLIYWTIEESRKSRFIDRIILSSEDPRIIAIGRKLGVSVPFIRPSELARDDASMGGTVLHAISALKEKFDYLVLLQPTSPLRITEDIDGCIAKCIDKSAPACVTVTIPDKNPFWMYSLDAKERLVPVIKNTGPVLLRQQIKGIYELNGAVYVVKVPWFIKKKVFIAKDTVAYPMPGFRSIDIDTELDLKISDMLLKSRELMK